MESSDSKGSFTGTNVYRIIEDIFSLYIPSVIVSFMGVFITAEILGRLIFNYSFLGVVDIVEQTVVMLTFLTLASVQRERAHITVDLLAIKLGEKKSAFILDCILLVLGIAGMLFVLGATSWYLKELYSDDSKTMTLMMPIWIFAMSMPIGSALMIIRQTIQLKQSFHRIKTSQS